MTTYRLDENETKLPANAQALDVVIYGNDAYRLYEDPQRGLRMWRVNVAEISAQLDAHYDSMVAADYDATMRAASNQWGY